MPKTLLEIAQSKNRLQEKISLLLEEYMEDNPEVKLTNVNVELGNRYDYFYHKYKDYANTRIILVVK